jgi:hypothetical protein
LGTLLPSLWTHHTRPVQFSLVVNDFCIKYTGRQHADRLLHSLWKLYTVTEDSTGSLFSGLTIEWHYANKFVDISMPKYIPSMLHKFQHTKPRHQQDAPHSWVTPTYGAKVQYAATDDNSPLLSSQDINQIQQIVGTLL